MYKKVFMSSENDGLTFTCSGAWKKCHTIAVDVDSHVRSCAFIKDSVQAFTATDFIAPGLRKQNLIEFITS